MADAENIGRINVWRNSMIAASAATDAPDIEAFGKMTIYRTERDAKRHLHHDLPSGSGAPLLDDDGAPLLDDDSTPLLDDAP